MLIVEPYAVMLGPSLDELNVLPDGTRRPAFHQHHGFDMLRKIEYAARVSHRSEDKLTLDSYDRFIRSVVLGHGDWSVVEHEKVSAEFLVDRGITHEIVRHRIASYTQESTRFVNYQKKGGEAKFIAPEFQDILDLNRWVEAMKFVEQTYMLMLDNGVKPQIARSVLPNALASKIVVTMNLRAWRHFFVMRTSLEAHPQMRQVTDGLLAEFQAKIPILYEDIVPGMRQAEAMRLAR